MSFRLLTAPVLCSAFCLQSYAQAPVASSILRVRFTPVLDGKPLNIDSGAETPTGDKLHVTALRCYVSAIALWKGDKEVWREDNSYHLLDAENPASLALKLSIPEGLEYNSIRFNLGIDSATSTSGAHGGELDPVRGMYWAWHSGYINFKLEGASPLSTARKHLFQFHLGGYQSPYSAMQPVALSVRPSDEVLIKMDLSRFLADVNLAKQSNVMVPGAEAVELSKKAVAIFRAE